MSSANSFLARSAKCEESQIEPPKIIFVLTSEKDLSRDNVWRIGPRRPVRTSWIIASARPKRRFYILEWGISRAIDSSPSSAHSLREGPPFSRNDWEIGKTTKIRQEVTHLRVDRYIYHRAALMVRQGKPKSKTFSLYGRVRGAMV